MSDTRWDGIVIGAGHNGLVAALRMARAGMKVCVVERRGVAGGLCAPRTFHPGYTVPGIHQSTALFRPKLAAELGLEAQGLSWASEPLTTFAASAGGGLDLSADVRRLATSLTRSSPGDAPGALAIADLVDRVRGVVQAAMDAPPPPLGAADLDDLMTLGKLGLALRRLGRADMMELLRVAPMCVSDWLGEGLVSQPLKAALALPAVEGTWYGPWSAGSAALLLFQLCLGGREVVGGPAAVVAALLKEAARLGVTVRLGAEVGRIDLEGGRVRGVTLASGERVDAPRVLASCDPKTALLDLLPARDLPVSVEDGIRTWRSRGSAARVHLALSGPLELGARPGEPRESIRVAGESLDDLERSFDALKYRRCSDHPALEVRVPSVSTPGLAPAGHHVASIAVSFAAHALEGGWTEEAKQSLGRRVVDRLAEHAPRLRERIVAMEVLSPVDLASEYHVSGGQLHHGEHALDQLLFMRPAPWAAQYTTDAVPGLFLCGSGSHPGGGVTGMPGWLGAAVALSS